MIKQDISIKPVIVHVFNRECGGFQIVVVVGAVTAHNNDISEGVKLFNTAVIARFNGNTLKYKSGFSRDHNGTFWGEIMR